LKGLRDGQWRKGPIEPIAVSLLDQDARFQNSLREFLDEQRISISLGDDLFHHFGGQRAAACHLRNYTFNVLTVEPAERQGADIGETSPGRFELRSKGDQCKDRQLAYSLDYEIE
jgi:hypothetical protein